MPIYEYQCDQCGHQLEVIQKISDAALRECPQCKQPALRKLVSAAGFRLKGGGWYETDFKGDRKRNVAQSDSDKGKKTADSSKPAPAGNKSSGA